MNNRGSFLASIPPVTKNLIIINILFWLATIVLRRTGLIDLENILGLHFWRSSDFKPVQVVSYMFMHDTSGPAHIFFNMFSLWMFGVVLERVMGMKHFLFFYLSCGLGAALAQELVWEFSWQSTYVAAMAALNHTTTEAVWQWMATGELNSNMHVFIDSLITVGASGAVFGILIAFAMLFPNMPMYLFFIPIPVKAKWMVLGYGLFELYFGVTGRMDSVAHFAHLGGMIVGFILIWYWKRSGTLKRRNGYY